MRPTDGLRSLSLETGTQLHPDGSCLIKVGDTHVLCSAVLEAKVPGWMKGQGRGWLTAEYGMLPASTHTRTDREAARGKQGGRTVEIQRLIGRSLRQAVDLQVLGERQISLDCDVLNADGGTRCASITGACVALEIALRRLFAAGELADWPMRGQVAAVSAGIVQGEPILDLCYTEDSAAEVDMNVVMTSAGKFVEIQGTAEGAPLGGEEMQRMLELAKAGLKDIFDMQRQAVASAVR